MPRNHPSAPSATPAERDLHAAIDRIQDRMPKNRKLLAILKETGSIALNKFNVALESGRSRTTLDKYPAILARIEALAKPATNSSKDALQSVRAQKAEAELLCRQLATTVASLLNREIKLERELKNAPRELRHVRDIPDPNRAIGSRTLRIVAPSRTDNDE
jgi:hypothetical protein